MSVSGADDRPILIVDDETAIVESIATALSLEGFNTIRHAYTSAQALEQLAHPVAVLCLDLNLPRRSGLELLPEILATHPDLPVIVITAMADLNTAVECMKLGAYDYLVKPIDRDRLVTTVRHAIERSELTRENRRLRDTILQPDKRTLDAFAHIVTQSELMLAVFRYAEAIGKTAFPVLVTGESGVGKELLARAIHEASGREGSFVPVNVAGLDDTLFSDTLFGHTRGAYTGATGVRAGLVKSADGGTLFLDEVGDLAAESQVKLLRLIQEGEYTPLGSDAPQRTSARFVFATNRSLSRAVADGSFRHDLYFRLTSHSLNIPPLRERPEHIPLLVDYFAKLTASQLGLPETELPEGVRNDLIDAPYPGNVREVQGRVADAVVRLSSGLPHGSQATRSAPSSPDSEAWFSQAASLPTIRAVSDALIQEALRRTSGNQTAAARLIGLSREALNRRLRQNNEDE